MEFVIVNGKVVAQKEANLCDVLWGNPFIISQKVWFGFGGIPLLDENIKALNTQLNSFNIQLPELFQNKRELFRLSKRMLNKNKFYRSGYISYQFYISGEKIHSLITSTAFSNFEFPLSDKGLILGKADDRKSSYSTQHHLKCHNQLLWQSAQKKAKLSANESLIFVNEKDKLCEGLAANLFLIKDDVLATPALSTGCYHDVLRDMILEQAKKLDLKIIESAELRMEHILEMDEVFLASEEKGIQWVLGVNNKRFVNEQTKIIYYNTNEFLNEKVS